jgi:hypothetical protein
MRKAKIVLAVGGLAVLASLGASAAAMRTGRITFDNYQRIAAGMSRSEVEAILGPAGDFTTGPTSHVGRGEGVDYTYRLKLRGLDVVPDPPQHLEWLADNLVVGVSFDSTGRVNCKEFCDQEREDQTPLQNLCWLAFREWRRWFPKEQFQTGYIRPQPPEF